MCSIHTSSTRTFISKPRWLESRWREGNEQDRYGVGEEKYVALCKGGERNVTRPHRLSCYIL